MKLLSAYNEQLCFPVHNCATLQKAFGVIHVSVAFSSRYCTCKILIRRLELLQTRLASCEYFKRNFFGGLSINIDKYYYLIYTCKTRGDLVIGVNMTRV